MSSSGIVDPGHSPAPEADLGTARKLTGVLFGGVALASTAFIAAVTLASIAMDEILGSATLAGVPGATSVVGTAVGTTLLTLGVARRGRRPGLVTGYLLSSLGALICIFAVIELSALLLIAGSALLGLGNASTHIARYAAAEMFPADRRGTALGFVVWAATIGSVAGPALLAPSGRFAESLGRSELVGGYVVALAFMAMAALLYQLALRPDPASVAVEAPTTRKVVWSDMSSAFRSSQVKVAISAMVAGQVVMVMIMTATPLHIHHHGSGLGVIGLVMSAHTLGMFALAPVVGRLADRFGGVSVALAGMAVLAAAAVGAAYTPAESTMGLVASLWALGIGWNMTFVSGSSLLAARLASDIRARVQGSVDSITWGAAAVAAAVSGVLYQAADYRVLGFIGLGLLVAPLVVVLRNRRLLEPAPVSGS